jgi:glycosyltransferase involved in cell wall biosynthesis
VHLQGIFYGNPDYYPPMINAATVLEDHKITQHIVCTDFTTPLWQQAPIEYPEGTRITRITRRWQNSLLNYADFCLQVLRLTDRRSDWITAYDMHAFLPARLTAWLLNKRLLYHSHDYVENSAKLLPNAFVIKQFERSFARTADIVVVPDRERASVMARELKLKTEPLIVANSALTAPDTRNSQLQVILRQLGKSFDKIVFRPGRVGRGHAIDVTIRSMPMWDNPQWGFVVMGPGEESDKRWLEQVAAEVGVSDRFVLLPAVSYTQVLDFTSGATLGHGLYEPVHFNHRYPTLASNKIMEYIAAGLPLLLSTSKGNQALVDRYHNGLIVPPDSPRAIAAAVNRILGSDALADQLAAGSRRAFRDEFNYEHQYRPVIERLLA